MSEDSFYHIPGDLEVMKIHSHPVAFTINKPDSKMFVSVNYDGTITYGPDYKPDAAARIFWEAMGDAAPMKRIAAIEAENEELKKALKQWRVVLNHDGSDNIAARAAYLGEKE